MFDSGPDEQNFTPGGGNYYGPEAKSSGGFGGIGAGMGGIKKFIPLIIIVIILIVAAVFGLSYITSQKDITINLVDSDGNPADGKITLKDAEQKLIQTDPKTTASSFSAKLFAGTYRVTATGTGYKTTISTITVTNDTTNFDINLTKDLKAALSAEFEQGEIYEGQNISGKLSVTNSGPTFKTTDIISASDAPLDVKLIYPSETTVTSPGSLFIDFNAGIKAGSNLKDIKTANLAFKIKGSDIISNKISLHALPAVAAKDVTLSASLTNNSLTAGKETAFQITVKNGNKTIPMKDIRLEVIPDAGYEDELSWFYFSNPSADGKYIKMIDSIDPTKQDSLTTLFVKSAITAKKDTEFHGTLAISSISMNGEKNPLVITLKIGTENSSKVDLVGIDAPFTINCPKAGGACETKSLSNGEVYLINRGNVDVSNIKIEIVSTPPTTANCYSFLTNMSTLSSTGNIVSTLKPTEKATIIMDITAPEGTSDILSRCLIQWKYVDPLSDPPNTITNVKTLEVNRVER